MITIPIGKMAALCSAALLLGCYVWFQSRDATSVATSSDKAAEVQLTQSDLVRPVEFTTIPGILAGRDQAVSNIQTARNRSGGVLPSSKSAPAFLRSSDSKVLPVPAPEPEADPATSENEPRHLPGSKSIDRLLRPQTVDQLLKRVEKRPDEKPSADAPQQNFVPPPKPEPQQQR